ITVAFSLTLLSVGPGWTQGNAATPQLEDPFVGIWKMNPAKSELDPNHRAAAATMHWQKEAGGYRMSVEGMNARGQVIREAPQRFIPDGNEHSVAGAQGVISIVTRPEPNVLHIESKKDGHIVGQASYVVSRDGRSLTATVSGVDAKQRVFQTRMVFDRE